MEKLDVKNIIEIDRIRKILSSTPDLLNIFEYIITIANQKINTETPVVNLPAEEHIEPDLSDHESDEDLVFVSDSD